MRYNSNKEKEALMTEIYHRKTKTNRKHAKNQRMRKDEDWILNVHAIKQKEQIEQLMYELRNACKNEDLNLRNELIAIMGVTTGLRIADILSLRVDDIFHKGELVTQFKHVDKKTRHTRQNNKAHTIYLRSNILRKKLVYYIKHRQQRSVWLFPASRTRTMASKKNVPLSTNRYYHILNHAAHLVGIENSVGTHTLRKTFGYWFYQASGNLAYLQDLFNHSSSQITIRYIDLQDDEIEKQLDKMFA